MYNWSESVNTYGRGGLRIVEQHRLLIVVSLGFALLHILFLAIIHLGYDSTVFLPVYSSATLIAVLGCLCSFWHRSALLAGQLVIASLVLLCLTSMITAEGMSSPAAIGLVMVLPCAILVLGVNSLFYWGPIVMLGTAWIAWADFHSLIPEPDIPMKYRVVNQYIAFFSAVFGCTLMSWHFARTAESLVLTLDEDRLRHEYEATHDHLTGLPNRVRFERIARERLARAGTDRMQYSLLFLDINGFKLINDHYGHVVGDGLLVVLAERVNTWVGHADLFARLAGDEFVLLVSTEIDADKEARLVQQIRAVAHHPFIVNGHSLSVSVSLGVARAPGDTLDFSTLMHLADKRMYRNKYQV